MGLTVRVMLVIFLFAIVVCCFGGGCGYNVVVSKDGGGNYTTVSEAVRNAPEMSNTPYDIYIRAGTFEENLYIPQNKTNIRLFGDGAYETIVYGNRTTNQTNGATIEIHGAGFNAAYMSFVNGAGLNAGQANAVKNAANNTLFYKCSIEGYQDTLYAVQGIQLYKKCEIYGTVDFIYGNAAAGFYGCMLYARFRGVVEFTAQGREDPTNMTGFLFQGCNFTMSPQDYAKKSQVSARLGRPWRAYSNVIIMESYIDDMVAPYGWDAWENVTTDELTYVEYNNVGPGSNTDERVKWPGVKAFHNLTELAQFLVAGHSWIPVPWKDSDAVERVVFAIA